MHTPAKYEKNPLCGCEAIAKRKCRSGGSASPIYKQASLAGCLLKTSINVQKINQKKNKKNINVTPFNVALIPVLSVLFFLLAIPNFHLNNPIFSAQSKV